MTTVVPPKKRATVHFSCSVSSRLSKHEKVPSRITEKSESNCDSNDVTEEIAENGRDTTQSVLPLPRRKFDVSVELLANGFNQESTLVPLQ